MKDEINDKVGREAKMRYSILNNKIWDRDFLDWLMLLLGVGNLIVVVNFHLSYWAYFNMFVTGLCLSGWLYSGLINRSQALTRRSIKISKKILKDYKTNLELLQKVNQLQKYKGVLKGGLSKIKNEKSK
jgi:hypothetical protein